MNPLYFWHRARYILGGLLRPWVRIRELERELKDFQTLSQFGVKADGNSVDMTFNSPSAKMLAGMWVDFFHQNSGKNFVTMELKFADPWWKPKKRSQHAYVLTVQRLGGLSPAQKLGQLEDALRDANPEHPLLTSSL